MNLLSSLGIIECDVNDLLVQLRIAEHRVPLEHSNAVCSIFVLHCLALQFVDPSLVEPRVHPGLQIDLKAISIGSSLEALDEVLESRVTVLVPIEVSLYPLLHGWSADVVVNLLEEASSLAIANLVEDVDGIVGMVHSHGDRVSGPPSIVT